ncbi:LOW QUALITY PROTEIN: protein max-like [Neomonachus schauinslandi]|uniref:Protein max n=1 Tax=Neomonachus schauinslandi TaxID=29088 RepID=A0A8M1MFJ3_NEOSC|nr:LOW QUALITY PROTEIN: protein max-like [Neomonachus schauinslandi]
MSDNNDMEMESYEEQPRFQSAADKQAHHNALEQKRSNYIKDSFQSLWDSVPSLQGQQAPWAQTLDKATEYIQYMQRKNYTHQQDIEDLKEQNALLEQQVRALEKARSSVQLQTNYPSSDNSLYTNAKGSTISAFNGGSHCSLESEPKRPQSNKKLQMGMSAIQTVRVLHQLTLLSVRLPHTTPSPSASLVSLDQGNKRGTVYDWAEQLRVKSSMLFEVSMASKLKVLGQITIDFEQETFHGDLGNTEGEDCISNLGARRALAHY